MPGIVPARHLAGEDAFEVRHVVIEITGGGVDGRGDGNPRARALAVADVNGASLQFDFRLYFLFQRMPSFVSSNMMPWSDN